MEMNMPPRRWGFFLVWERVWAGTPTGKILHQILFIKSPRIRAAGNLPSAGCG